MIKDGDQRWTIGCGQSLNQRIPAAALEPVAAAPIEVGIVVSSLLLRLFVLLQARSPLEAASYQNIVIGFESQSLTIISMIFSLPFH